MTYSLGMLASQVDRDAREIRESSKAIRGGRTASELLELARKMALVTVAAHQSHFCQGRRQPIESRAARLASKWRSSFLTYGQSMRTGSPNLATRLIAPAATLLLVAKDLLVE